MIEALFKHLSAMTSNRDQAQLDASIIAALQELAGASQIRALELFKLDDLFYLRPRVWFKDGHIVSADENELDEQGGEPVSHYPALLNCLTARTQHTEEIASNGNIRLWFPVWLNDKVTTCLEISNPKPYPAATMTLIDGLLSLYRNYRNLLDYSERDSLTGLLNRKTFDERFSRMVSANARHEDRANVKQPERRQSETVNEHWLAVVDIDHFKRINDQFGHLYGDEVLILIANLLRSSFRLQDRVFRFGREEFVVLLRSTTLENAMYIFERFRANVEEHVFPQIGTVTVSIGFARISAETPVVILGHADQALYYAKANGRNRICHYDQLVENGLLHSERSNESVEFFFEPTAPV